MAGVSIAVTPTPLPPVMIHVRCPLSLRKFEDLLPERGIEISHETIRFW
jgi:transposase-like protein